MYNVSSVSLCVIQCASKALVIFLLGLFGCVFSFVYKAKNYFDKLLDQQDKYPFEFLLDTW